MKSLFNEDKWTEKATEFDEELSKAIKPILEKYIQEGYSIRDIMLVASECPSRHCLRALMEKNRRKSKS